MKCLKLNAIPGMAEAIAHRRAQEQTIREDAWLERTYTVNGFRIRTMRVRDYVLLERLGCPLLQRQPPMPEQLTQFLWALSPAMDLWHDEVGWRKWLPLLAPVHSWLAGRQIRNLLNLAEFQTALDAHAQANTGKDYTVPDDAPLARAIKASFEYVDNIFMDAPPAVRGGRESGLHYLTSWFCKLAEKNYTETDFWKLPLPKLFQILKQMDQSANSDVPNFDRFRDELFAGIQRALVERRYTYQDLAEGRVDLLKNELKNN